MRAIFIASLLQFLLHLGNECVECFG